MITIRQVTESDADAWLKLRHALWPDAEPAEHRVDIERFLAGAAREPQAVLLAIDENGETIGLTELSIRSYAEGCSSDQVAFLEGWYVAPGFRRRGVGKALVAAAEHWSIAKGCTEFASDALANNELSAAAHRQCGFAEVTVIRCFRKDLPNNAMQATCEDARG
jgi:aminoglycoside 6'-N-acetyltransferase I